MTNEHSNDRIRETVREHYAATARRLGAPQRTSCCAEPSSCGISTALYNSNELASIPELAVTASLGCGNPTLLAELKPGEVVLDLGSGGGIDVLLSAKRVGSTGKAYGLDMTDEMLALARANARQAGVTNVEFLKGEIESIPLPDESVDVIISNCVINLSADKDAVLAEAFRVLRPDGRFAVADVVVQGGSLTSAMRQVLSLWAGCIAGALTEEEYRQKLAAAGFGDIGLRVLKTYSAADVSVEAGCCAPPDLELDPGTNVVSAFVTATKVRS